ncbi:ShlB/FhaC/HecB family hemolysin secretion/activation protein [Steroidobacter cummioxidans]|uniref:ShlB/FhaC/HecB family hemolysin secretion/activation protein n=1 Tax=Steroidobacter cummioxidans TaxID=1803913 RepID=UPI000E30F9EF|nr:ShlB/FhaC/HecB family hemolysin secretion/activation protein [Steroidobacter cummioxidans]
MLPVVLCVIRSLACTGLSVACAVPVLALAQVPPDAGRVQRQLEQTLTPPPTQTPAPAESQVPIDRTGPRITLKRVFITGTTLLPPDELARHLDSYIGQSLSMGELQAAAQTLVGYYRERGWFVRVLLPEQDVSKGTLHIQIVEGRFGSMHLQPEGKTRAKRSYVARVVGRQLQAGEPYALAELERGLLLANDLPGIGADGVLQAGSTPGSSDLALSVSDRALFSGQLGASNFGSRFTGRNQGSLRLAADNPSGYGDQLSLTGLIAEQLDYQSLGYSLPLGYDGLRISVGYSQLHYRLGEQFADLDAKGDARTATAALAYPLVRSTARNVWLGLTYVARHYDDESLGMKLHDRRSDAYTLTLHGDSRDTWGGGGITRWRTELTGGRISLRLDDDRAQDAAGPDIAGGFTRINAELSRDQVLAPAYYLRARFVGQWAANNLDSAQQFSLGGPYDVRGYPMNEGSGDGGALLQLELHTLLPRLGLAGLDGYLFFDSGVVRQHQQTWASWDTQGTGRNVAALYATGAGIRWNHPKGLALDAAVAVPLGHDLADANRERNQDGSERGLRLWLTASQSF